MNRKGIILSGGTATRLFPATSVVSKQLLPVFDKPMIYYPLSTLIEAGISEILIISTPRDIKLYKNLLGNGSRFGIDLDYVVQNEPKGIAQSLIIAENFLENHPSALILGDNIFYGGNLSAELLSANHDEKRCTIFAYHVQDPERYGVVEFNNEDTPINIIEKPKKFIGNNAVTGLYFYPDCASEIAKQIKPSQRGELEITDLNLSYLKKDMINVKVLGKECAWFDTGTHNSLYDATSYVAAIQKRQGTMICSPEEIALNKNLIKKNTLREYASSIKNSDYGKYLIKISE